MRIEVESGGEKCSTAVLETYGHDDLESNQWDTYDNEAVLGECAEFLLYSGEGGVRVRVVYGGLGAYCADTINLQVSGLILHHVHISNNKSSFTQQVGYLDRSRFTCNRNNTQTWTGSRDDIQLVFFPFLRQNHNLVRISHF